MTDRPLVAIPIRSFEDPKRRLSPVLDQGGRRRLAAALAGNTATRVRDAGADVVVIAGAPDVVEWAERIAVPAILQPAGYVGLDGAARLGIEAAAANGRRGYILHPDLPRLRTVEVQAALRRPGAVIAPSYDGGTTLLGGIEPGFDFSYGVGSFSRHLAVAKDARVVVLPGLAADLDQPADLMRLARGSTSVWLRRFAAPS